MTPMAEPQTRPFLYDCVTCGHADPWHSMWPTLGETERACKAQGCECRVMVYPARPDTRPGLDALRALRADIERLLTGYAHIERRIAYAGVLRMIDARLSASPSTEAEERCGWDTRRGDGPIGGPCALPAGHDGPHDPKAASPSHPTEGEAPR